MLPSLDKYYSAGKLIKISTGTLKFGQLVGNLSFFMSIFRCDQKARSFQTIATFNLSTISEILSSYATAQHAVVPRHDGC
jgi:hypothetical protein